MLRKNFILAFLIFSLNVVFGQTYRETYSNYISKSNFQGAINLLKEKYYAVEDWEQQPVSEISSLLRNFEDLEKRVGCDKSLSKEKPEECYNRFIIQITSKVFIEKLYFFRAMAKYDKKDYYGSIADFEFLVTITSENSSKGEILTTIGGIYMELDEKQKACQHFSKATEYGNEKAENIISEYCNN